MTLAAMVAGAFALVTHDVVAAVLCFVLSTLAYIWKLLSSTSAQVREDFANYAGPVGKPLAWLLSKLPGSGAKIAGLTLPVVALGIVGITLAPTPTPGVLARAALVAKANAICATGTDAVFKAVGSDGKLAAYAQIRAELRKLKPAAAVAQDWHRVVAGLVANHELIVAYPAPDAALLKRKVRKGEAVQTRLGILCVVD
jgi:hypothetical protein